MTMDGGRFVGGAGHDSIDTKNGGPGTDVLDFQGGGIFRGNKGFDRLGRASDGEGLWKGEFNGGPVTDRVNLCDGGTGTTSQVEVTTNSICR
jgi:hypothetical protein